MDFKKVFETCILSEPDTFLQGDWFEGMMPLSHLREGKDGDLEVCIYNGGLSCSITCVVGKFDTEQCCIFGDVKLKNKPIRDCKVLVNFISESTFDLEDINTNFEVEGKVRSVIVKYMRNLVNTKADVILENQGFNHSNLYDGDELVGFR